MSDGERGTRRQKSLFQPIKLLTKKKFFIWVFLQASAFPICQSISLKRQLTDGYTFAEQTIFDFAYPINSFGDFLGRLLGAL